MTVADFKKTVLIQNLLDIIPLWYLKQMWNKFHINIFRIIEENIFSTKTFTYPPNNDFFKALQKGVKYVQS